MPCHDDSVCVRQMLDHAREAVQLADSRTRPELDADRVLALALAQLMMLLGEAAGRVSAAYQEAHPEIPWTPIHALKERLIHGYDIMDFDILWEIIAADLPPLVANLETVVAAEEDECKNH